ncbi:MAG: GntR family transcriptional regulator [Cellulosilyticaceae bacterium]
MDTKQTITAPRYQQIAADIASKIASKQYKEGERIYARSAIASQYGVSSETARRAICVLSDLNIVETAKGSGVVIKSYENANAFVKQYHNIRNINHIKKEMLESVERQKRELEVFNKCVSDLIDQTERFKSVNPFIPCEVHITKETPYIEKNVAEINFWHNTAATIIAISRKGVILMSPGPYATLCEGDVFYFVGDENCLDRVNKFLYP